VNDSKEDKVVVKKNKMIDDEKLKKYKSEKCNINYLDDVYCNRMEKMGEVDEKIQKELGVICSKKVFKKTDVCKDFNKNRWDDILFKNFCIKEPNNNYDIETCLKGEYFKENLLDFF